jgi:cation:H+ antiporter
MSVLFALLVLVVGLVVLIAGAEMLVRGAAQLARVLGMSAFAIGVTVVAFGTSAPELFASIGAAIQGEPELAIGNVVGSNIANILLILGIGATIIPITVQRRVRFIELPVMLAITLLVTVTMLDHIITRIESAMLLVGLVGYVWFIVRAHRVDIEHEGEEIVTHPKSVWVDLGFVLLGIVGLGLGAKGLVWGAKELAAHVGVSSGVVGATIVAFGTSLPELAVTIRAACNKSSDMAVGNIVGSNVFNLLCVLGFTASIKPLSMQSVMDIHIWSMVGVSVLLVGLVLVRPKLGRLTGVLFFLVYVGYIAFSFMDTGLIPR